MGNSAKKAQAGEHEKALAENATAIAARNKELYRPLQAGFVKEAARDVSGVLGGRANADTAQGFSSSQGASLGAAGSSGGFGSSRSLMGQAQQGALQSNALGGALGKANADAQSYKDKGQLGALKLGQGAQTIAMQGLGTAARAQNQELIAKSQAASSIQNTNTAFAFDAGAGAYEKFRPKELSQFEKYQKQIADSLKRQEVEDYYSTRQRRGR